MNERHQRDAAVERMLRGSTSVPRSTESCLDAETIAAWHDGGLTGPALDTAEAHLANCDRCQAVVKVLVRAAPALPDAQPLRRLWLRWALPLAAAATAVAIWLAVPRTPTSDIARFNEQEQVADAFKSDTLNLNKEIQGVSPDVNRNQSDASKAESPREPSSKKPAATPEATAQSPAPLAREEDTARDRLDESRSGLAKLEADRTEPQSQAAGKAAAPPVAATSTPTAPPPSITAPAQGATPAATAAVASTATGTIVVSPNSPDRWRISGRVVDYSSDAGASWQVVLLDATTQLTAGSAPSSSTCWLVGHSGTVWRSLDGRSFTRVSFPDRADLTAVRATDGFNAVATTVDGRDFATTDGGVSWTRR